MGGEEEDGGEDRRGAGGGSASFAGSATAMADALSLGAAKIRLHRARRALKAALESACTFERDEVNDLACAPKVDGLVSLARRR